MTKLESLKLAIDEIPLSNLQRSLRKCLDKADISAILYISHGASMAVMDMPDSDDVLKSIKKVVDILS